MQPSIELTSHCNNSCVFCPHQHNPIKRGFMEWDLFTELVDDLAPQSEALMLFSRGEPFLHPTVYKMIEYANKKCPVIISTNAILVDVKRLYDVFKEGTLCVSCPGGNQETYKLLTGSDSFGIVREKIRQLVTSKPERINLYVKMVKQKENEGQGEELKKLCKNVAVVDDSNNPNLHNYTECSQPDVSPTYRFDGQKVVCCRDWNCEYPYVQYYEQAKKRELPLCANCGIQ